MNAEEIKYLIGLCDREVGCCGLDTEAGRRAKEICDKLKGLVITLALKLPADMAVEFTSETHD